MLPLKERVNPQIALHLQLTKMWLDCF